MQARLPTSWARPMAVMVAVAALCGTCVMLAPPAVTNTLPFSRGALHDIPTSVLIDQLQEIDTTGYGYDPWLPGNDVFLAIDDRSSFDPIMRDELPEFRPQLRELVARGVGALPDLLAHLDDRRATIIRFFSTRELDWPEYEHADLTREWPADDLSQGNVYDSRFGNDLPPHVERTWSAINTHSLTVGDLCFVAIGQIVNRNYCTVQYTGSNTGEITSPTRLPQLVQAVRADWGNLTATEHRDSLIRDVMKSNSTDEDPFNARSLHGLQRLCFYYPADGERLLCQLMSRRIYNGDGALKFAWTQLLETPQERDRMVLIDDYLTSHRPEQSYGAYDLLIYRYRELENLDGFCDNDETGSFERPCHEPFPYLSRRARLDRMSRLLKRFAGRLGGPHQLQDYVSAFDQSEIILATIRFRSARVDRLLPQLRQQVINIDTFGARHIIEACEKREQSRTQQVEYRDPSSGPDRRAGPDDRPIPGWPPP